MKKLIILGVSIILGINLNAQPVYRTQIFNENIKTLQVKVNGNPLTPPVIVLNGNDELTISFDEMSHEMRSYGYSVLHCNADWTLSSLSTSEYIHGFTNGYITDHALSVNTTFLYTNYQFQLPNNDMGFMISGNYIVNIYEDNDKDNPVAHLRFYVVDPKVDVEAKVRGNTDLEINQTLQQLEFEIGTKSFRIQDPNSELKVTVLQNDRSDNAVTDIKPTFLGANKLSYINNRKLIFEGGNEYHRIDFSSIYNYDERINSIKFVRPHYEVFVEEHPIRANGVYQTDFDVNGRFVINYQNGYDSDVEADYMFVHFYLPIHAPLKNGAIYLGGNWNYNQMNEASQMSFDAYDQQYQKTLLLKQGGYNYQFWYAADQHASASVRPIDGSYWQAQNEYAIYVYYRPWGGRYDQLIGVHVL